MRPPTAPDGRNGPKPRLYVVALSHLDTQWRWTVRDTARRFLPDTVERNEPLFVSHPHYQLSFEGAWRYRLLELHHPGRFERVRALVAEGRWHPVGAAVEALDTLLPSPESILRQIHYGQRWFGSALGRESTDLFLPDCFGFPATLPTLAAHAGLVGFSTQKLRRGERMRAAFGIPFPYGRWRGPDGSELLAVLDPGEYSARVEGDLSRDPEWERRFAELASAGRPALLMTYTGCGDRGGAPPRESIAALEASLASDGPIEVRHGASDRIYRETTAEDRARLPVHDGELLLRLHATGCYTAKAEMKAWNRRNERLARAAEAAAASARALGRAAPVRRIEDAWWRFLVHQMHDDLTGTAIPTAYRISLADEALAANELSEVLLDAAATVAARLDRSRPGRPLLLFNPLGIEREELVEIRLDGREELRVLDPEGRELPTQRGVGHDGGAALLFPARLAPFEFAVHALLPGAGTGDESVSDPDELADQTHAARFDGRGNLSSLLDRRLGRELLAEPARLELFDDRSSKYPAWEILWEDLARGPRSNGVRLLGRRWLERGPLRRSLELERRIHGARLVERWSLASGAGGATLECAVTLDWRGRSRLLKSAWRFRSEAEEADYDTGLAPVRRGVSSERLYEVPAQHWAALSDPDRGWGVAVLSDVRSGWDHPDRATLRSTWIHAPRASWKWRHQRSQDDGRHRFRFALAGFAGSAVEAGVPTLAERFTNPILAFFAEPGGAGELGTRWSAVRPRSGAALVQAFKPSEEGHELVVRWRNPAGRSALARIGGLGADTVTRALDARERPLPETTPASERTSDGVAVEVPSAGLATIGIAAPAPSPPSADSFRTLSLPLDVRACAARGETGPRGFDGAGRRFPAESFPERVDDAAVPFELASPAGATALAAAGQELGLPPGFAEAWLLGASIAGDLEVEIGVDGTSSRVSVPDWRSPLYQPSRARPGWLGGAVRPALFRRVPVAWVAPFLRDRAGRDLVAEPGMLFALRVPLAGARSLRLPHRPELRLVAATLARKPARALSEANPLAV